MARTVRTWGWGIVIGGLGLLAACGDGGGGSGGKPDTGYGAAQTVPATRNCADFCQRAADCAGHLCDEDKNSTAYLSLIPLLSSSCQSSCTDAAVSGGIDATQWQCLFQSSCRQIFGENVCHTSNTSYTCN